MKLFVSPEKAPPAPRRAQFVATGYAVVLVGLALAQLYTFDIFVQEMPRHFTDGMIFAHLAAPLIVAMEIFALPYLLRMAVSGAFRWLSMLNSLLVPLFWFFLSMNVVMHSAGMLKAGIFGDVVTLSGWATLGISLGLGTLAAYVVWALGVPRIVQKQ